MSRQKPSRRPAKTNRRKFRIKPLRKTGGWGSLTLGGILFALGGTFAIWSPIQFFSSAGMGRRSRNVVDFVYGENTTVGFGVFFILISIFLFLTAFHLWKRTKK